jgi:lactoylglutathione lyase
MIYFIIYVADQEKSMIFYSKILEQKPALHVPGMTEFRLAGSCTLGIMPESGIAKILGDKTPHPSKGNGIPRAEVYLPANDLHEKLKLCTEAGATLISGIEKRNWGDTAFYVSDPDGHIIAFASTFA